MGRGDSLQFWSDLWLGSDTLKSIFPSLYDACELKRGIVADMGERYHDSWSWNWNWANNLQGEEAGFAVE